MSAVVVAALASGVAACGGGHNATWRQGYSYGQGAARQDYTGGPITGAAAGDACNHSLSAVPDGFGDPSSQDWTSGFMAGCKQALSVTRTAAKAAGSASPAASSARATTTSTAPAAATYKPWTDPSNGNNTCTYVHPEASGIEVALLMQGTLQYPNDPAVCYSALNAELAKYDQGAGDTLPGTWTYQPGAAPVTVGGCNGTVGDVTVTIGLAGRAVMNDTNLTSAPGYTAAENDSSSYCGGILNPYG